ncbi:type II toxin-antitoxin system RelE/ParE family toxin [Novosphingobium sp. FSW06-99]|uniref:type II toxin-antitoxin system RelE/ParE family toxin n=1 Tax=Novosphingobium sp. FSW06-99 TaxID=1739113 RepID=UPI00076C3C85|nr:type II toxin-antitoxin system RelE/ParE family toxin [Novosphingobium sp. FSW06-99]KUR80734.1 hypothetical protein AQZ49_01520 [Novosphingobium sp. FSW06-99]
MKIITIRDKRLKALVENPGLTAVKGLDPFETRRIIEMLAAIRVMNHPLDLLAFPKWKAHELKPGQPGKWALTVTGNYRLTFRVDIARQEVTVLDYEDYH